MKSNHISYTTAIITIIRVIYAGESPFRAIQTCFAMRRLVNQAYDLGLTPDDLLTAIEH